MKKITLPILIVLITLLFTGCAPVSHIQSCLSTAEHTYGFWGGVWHGLIMTPAFIISLFDSDVAIYAVNNNGWPYNFGFIGGFWFILRLLNIMFKKKD